MLARMITIAVAAGAALTACAGGSRVGPAELTTLYSANTMGYAARGGELATEVRGNPFPGALDAERLAGSLKSPAWHRPFRLTTRPNPQTVSSYHLILRFNPPVGGPIGERLCRGEEPGVFGPGGGPISVQGVLCADDRLASEVRAYGPAASGPDDPAFQSTMNALLADLLPPRNPKIDTGDKCGDC